ncbi:MAG: DNA-3-methyladenine glycosylase I [Anaerolineales bacterium]|nr:MAG: DNA-3-methyladenine glycosylase I [Anaerolineales bacterium]
MADIIRCFGTGDPLMAQYHDDEWGVPVYDDRLLFEKLLLDGFQAGLSWRTVLHKRENFRAAFEGFIPERMAGYGDREVQRLLQDAGIIRNRLKIGAAITNAQAYLMLVEREGSFSDFLWSFTGGKTLRRKKIQSWADLPTSTPESDAMTKSLKLEGFKFVGTTICYAFMQAVGMVDDHFESCFRYGLR